MNDRMNDHIRSSIDRMRNATIDRVNPYEDGMVQGRPGAFGGFPPPDLWRRMAVRFHSRAIAALTTAVLDTSRRVSQG